MVRRCVVCKTYGNRTKGISFHAFTKNKQLRKEWFTLLNFNEERKLLNTAKICSQHFRESDFDVKPSGLKYLKKDAKPLPYSPDNSSTQELSSSSSGSYQQPFKRKRTDSSANTNTLLELQQNLPLKNVHKSSSSTLTASELEHNIENRPPGTSTAFQNKRKNANSKKRYAGDIASDDFSSPKKARKHARMLKGAVVKYRKRIVTLNQKVRRFKSRVNNLKSLLTLFRKKEFISENSAHTIQASVSNSNKVLLERLLLGPKKQKYTPALREFALTLNFYSARAYKYVRDVFNKTLPHPRTLSKWYCCVNGEPGFTQEALATVKLKCEEATTKGVKILCNLVMDEMSIRKQVEWTGTKFTGYVNVGCDLHSDCLPEAKEVLVFMLVALNAYWKISVGYFLLNGLSSVERATLLQKCLEFVHDSGVVVTSVTFDGAPVNFSMADVLGADLHNADNLKPFFLHPITNSEVYIFLDACHMLKLVRNCWGTLGVIEDFEDNKIEWSYITRLVDIQNLEGLHAATKIKNRHLAWIKEKMRVKIAAQTLSKSVSDALIYLCDDLHLKDFENAKPTAQFILIFNDLFDMLNSRNRFAKYFYKQPFSLETREYFFTYLERIENYIKTLKIKNELVIGSQRKTGFLGFLICIKSIQSIYEKYVIDNKVINYLLSYKFSQDHLELFFGAVRSRGGWNNNPTARQFSTSYKRLLLYNQIKAGNSGNAVNLDATSILYYTGSKSLTANDNGEDLSNFKEVIRFQQEVENDLEHYNFLGSSMWHLTDYAEDVVTYIAGFVIKCLKRTITCSKCVSVIEDVECHSMLQARKEYKRLTSATPFAISICKAAEKYFQFFHKTRGIFNKNVRNLNDILINGTLQTLPSTLYNYFGNHLFDGDIVESHATILVKLVLAKFFKLRIHHEVSKSLDLKSKDRCRSVLTKTILFKNQ